VKQVLALAAVLAIAGVALYFAQHKKRADTVSANAVLDVAADWQHDLSRVPLRITRISDSQEQRIGDELARNYESAEPAHGAKARAAERYVNEVGARIAAHAKRTLRYRFHVVADGNFINAFALPGGHVFVGQGLLDRTKTEDELAFVLGHEIEHIDHRHAVERIQIEAQLKKLNLDIVAGLAQIPVSIWQAGYSKDEELEADREGLRLAVAAGYSAKGAIDLLERWTRLYREYVIHANSPTEELSKIAIGSLTGYFRTHPLPSERLSQAKEVIAHDHLPLGKPLQPFRMEHEIATHDH
jgi:predicted Zn-dependent protease